MRKRHLVNLIFPAMALMSVSSCQDYDANFSEEALLKQQYADQFEKMFGKVDPNQDWSMAQSVSVDINVPSMNVGEVTVYSNSPLGSSCKILGQAKVSDGKAEMNIDVVKGTTTVYVVAKDKDGMPINGYFEIADNTLTISKGAATRAGEASPVTIGDQLNYQIYMLPANVATVDGAAKKSASKTQEGQTINYEYWDGVSNTQQSVQNLYYLNDVDYNTRTDVMHLGDLATFLRSYKNTEDEVKPGVFKEGIEHISLMGTELQKDAYYVMAEDGPITMSYIYKGTVERHNYFGYFYYPKDEEMNAEKFRTINKYILVNYITGAPDQTIHHSGERTKDVTYYVYQDEGGEEVLNKTAYYKTDGWNNDWNSDPSSHFIAGIGYPVVSTETFDEEVWWPIHETYTYYIQTTKTVQEDDPWDEVISGNGSLIQRRYRTQQWNPEKGDNEKTGPWTEWANASGMEMPSWIASEWNDDDEIMGTKFKLTFFGYDGTASPTYTFPKDCKVGFFFVKYFDNETDSNNKLYTSFSSINLDYINEVPTAATFRYRNYVVLGLEDQPYGDCDQNDVLFLAEGNFDTEEIPDLTPDDDPEKEPVTQKWLVACEDLGGTFDYDFNDIVIGFEKKADNHLYMKVLAAGGTLPTVVGWTGYTGDKLKEVHQMLGAEPSEDNYTQIMSSTAGEEIDLGECENEFSINTAISKLSLNVKNAGENVDIINVWKGDESNGTAPQAILLPGDWDWPTEGTRITSVYPSFVQWSQDVKKTNWINNGTNGSSVIRNPWR